MLDVEAAMKTATLGAQTYLPEPEDEAASASLAAMLTVVAPQGADQAVLVTRNGTAIPLPPQVHEILLKVAEALATGMSVTVAPLHARLTTQEAADFLGISRPTLVRMLEAGKLPMTKPGRHRFVMLRDLLDFREEECRVRNEALGRRARRPVHEDGRCAADANVRCLRGAGRAARRAREQHGPDRCLTLDGLLPTVAQPRRTGVRWGNHIPHASPRCALGGFSLASPNEAAPFARGLDVREVRSD